MSQKNNFTKAFITGDDHGVSDLLRQVAERSSLNPDERKEVTKMMKRVETHAARATPMGKLKKKIADTMPVLPKGSDHETNNNDSTSTSTSTSTSGTEAKTKWGKDLLEKITNIPTIPNPLLSASSNHNTTSSSSTTAASTSTATSKLDPKEVFRNLSMKNPLLNPSAAAESSAKIKARKEAIRKALERSSQSGRDLLQNFSKNVEHSLQKLDKNLETSLRNLEQSLSSNNVVEAEYDVNSPEYKMDLKGIALLQEIFPDESTEKLIKMHFEHINANKSTTTS